MSSNTYGDIGDRTAAYAVKEFLARAHPYLVLEKFGQHQTLPGRSTKTVKFRRFNALPNTPVALVEGVAPAGTKLTTTDVTLTLAQYGSYVPLTDIIMDTHEDPVLQQATEVLSQQGGEMIENVRYGVLKACSNVFYAGSGITARSSVAAALDLNLQRKVTRSIKRQNGRTITKIISASVKISTEPVRASYVAVIHPDLEPSVRGMTGFVPSEKYSGMTPWENELGKVEDVRYITSTLCSPYANAGGTASATWVSTGGTSADVYPVIYIGADSYGLVALKGKFAVEMFVANPRPQVGDPLAQQGSAGWKSMQGAVILNDLWMAVAEVAAPAL